MGLQDADANDAGFGARIRSAILWRSGSQILSQMMSWIVTLAVIRLLDPADYGLFAMTQVILNFATFLNGYGLVSALVQSDSVTPHRLRQAFGIMLLLNGGLALLQLLIAPLAADYYDQPMVADLLRVQALLYLSTPFLSVPEAIMGRALVCARAALITGAHSVSTSSTLASPCSRMKASEAGSRRVFKAFSTAPAMGMPKCASSIGGVLGHRTATVSPRPTPRPRRALASRRQRRPTSPQLSFCSP